jgi:transposase
MLLRGLFGEEAVGVSSFRHCVRLFKSGEQVTDEGPRIGRPNTAATTEIKENVDVPTRHDLRTITSELRAAIGIGKRTVMTILEELGYRIFCAVWVGKILVIEHKTARKTKHVYGTLAQ